MSYLLTQMFIYLLVAFLLGLLLGWLIWRYGKSTVDTSGLEAERDRLRAELEACGADRATLKADLDACTATRTNLQARLDAREASAASAVPAVAVAPVVETVAAPVAEASRPEGLSAPRGGQADDLKLISGVGPKMERLCNELGFYHFDQIANWSPAEVAWVDENLEGFKGRVTRDNWIAQARDLARS